MGVAFTTMRAASRRRAAARPAHAARTLVTRPLLRRLFWTLDRLKSGKPLRASDVARELEVSVRTAYRDLGLLRDDWRVPLEYDRHQGTYRLTGPVGSLPLVSLSQGELLAIYFAEKVLHQYRGTPFEPDLASAFAKMQELLPEEVKVSPESLDAYLSLDLGPLHIPDAALFREILTAQRLRRRAVVRYRSLSSNRTTEYAGRSDAAYRTQFGPDLAGEVVDWATVKTPLRFQVHTRSQGQRQKPCLFLQNGLRRCEGVQPRGALDAGDARHTRLRVGRTSR